MSFIQSINPANDISLGRKFCLNNECPTIHERNDTDDMYRIYIPATTTVLRFEVDGRVIHDGRVGPGVLILSKPNSRERARLASRSATSVLHIPGMKMRNLLTKHGCRQPEQDLSEMTPLSRERTSLHPLLRTAHALTKDSRINHRFFLDGLSEMIVALIVNGVGSKLPMARQAGLTPMQLRQCVNMEESSESAHLDVSSMATAIGMSRVAFSRRFQIATSETPYAWLLRRRIKRAQNLLASTLLPLCEVAEATAFCSQSHFTTAFRAQIGVSPGAWRDSLQISRNRQDFLEDMVEETIQN